MQLSEMKWVSFAIYHNEPDKILKHVILPVLPQVTSSGIVSNYFFARSKERGEHLLLLFQIQKEKNQELQALITPSIEAFLKASPAPFSEQKTVVDWFLPFPVNHIEFNDNFLMDIMETGGLQASFVAEKILGNASRLILEMMNESEEWSGAESIGLGIQMHTVLAFYLCNKDVSTIQEFYTFFFEELLKLVGNDDLKVRDSLLNGLQETFQEQQEPIVEFIQYLISMLESEDQFDEQWLNIWMTQSKEAGIRMTEIQEQNQYIAPENFEFNSSVHSGLYQQEKWPAIQYLLRSINHQMNIVDVYELNLVFSLKEGFRYLKELQKT